VIVAGQWCKRDHHLVGVDRANVEKELRESGNYLAGEMESRFLSGPVGSARVLYGA
jgi:hypothetical protein